MKIGLSSMEKEYTDELFKSYKASGIEAMEVSVSLTEQFEALDLPKIKELADKYGILLWSFHLPFGPFEDIDVSRPELKAQTVKYFCECIEKVSKIGIKLFIIHPSGEPIRDDDRKIRLETAKESLSEIAEFADKFGAVIAVEDLPRTCLGRNSDELLELISANDKLKICFDTNHLLSEPISDFIEKAESHIITLHVSDYDFLDERHWLPGEGDIDWEELYSGLIAKGYDNVWLYEISFKCPATIQRDRDLTCSDFARNAKEIFEHKKPTVFAKRFEK